MQLGSETGSAETPGKKPLFKLPEYDLAEVRFVHIGVRRLMDAQDSFYAQIQKVPKGEGLYRNQNTMPSGDIVRSEPIAMESPVVFSFVQIRGFDVDHLAVLMNDIAAKHVEIMMKHMFQQMADLCSATGNSIDAGGAPISHDLILDMLETVEISFDEVGEPKMPTMVVSPEMADKLRALPLPTVEQMRRREEILERKRNEFNARKRHRKLFRHAD